MKKLILAATATLAFAFTPAAFAGSSHAPAAPSYGHQNYAPQSYAPQGYSHQGYSQQGYAPTHASQEDEVIVYEERTRRKQSYYFKPRDARSFKCRTKYNTQKCTFDFHGDNANDVEYYLAQALIYATGNTQNQAECFQKRRAESVTCAVRGDLRGMDTGKLRYALYGR